MRAVLQRVLRAAVYVVDRSSPGASAEAGQAAGNIGRGFVVLLGVHVSDVPDDAAVLAGRVAALRVFDDDAGRLNRSLLDVGGEVLSVPQFTLYADTRKGRRPSFIDAAPPERAEPLYLRFNAHLAEAGVRVVPGRFRTHMVVELQNDGPVTIILDSSARG
jgi:D-aminoacyl-tRNA deacylase